MEGEIAPPGSSVSVTPSSCCTYDNIASLVRSRSPPESAITAPRELTGDWFDTEEHRILLETQQMVNRYNDSFRRLQNALADVDVLRQENLRLAADNLAIAFLIEDLESADAAAAASVSDEKRAVREKDPAPLDCSDAARGDGCGVSGVPKSISIRSCEFLAIKNPEDGEGRRPHRLRLPLRTSVAPEGEEEELEVEAYGQGAVKTELCNKWEETNGWCPYGERCRFAHGVEELRPVLRHPRYKTLPCRMLSGPGGCPYGHRCHFRHAALPRSTLHKR